jgi:DNA-binding transcriptional LysR family regulator
MELRHLKYFVAVAERRGFREASRFLHVAQPAISQTVSNLEAEIGVKLFMRSGRNVKLTPEGEVFYTETLHTLEQSRNAVEAAQRASSGEVGTVSVGFCGAATYAFLPGIVQRYREQFPGVKLALQELTPLQQEPGMIPSFCRNPRERSFL